MEKGFELRLRNKSSTFMTVLMLSLFETNGAMKKCDDKKGIVHLYCT